jgi:hypothetical protein
MLQAAGVLKELEQKETSEDSKTTGEKQPESQNSAEQ